MKILSGISGRLINILFAVCLGILILAGAYACTRIFIADRFTVRGHSMEPTLRTGRHIIVNKLIIGPRIYRDFDFSKPEMRSFRLPGFRHLTPGDIAVFNYPEGWEAGKIGFKINYVYAKRCLGAPGDTVGAQKGHCYSTGADPVGIPVKQEAVLRATPDSSLTGRGLEAGQFAGLHGQWTIRDFGPLVVPEKGMTVPLDSMGVRLYAKSICYETGTRPEWSQGQAWLNGRALSEYTFQKNWYFFVGDHIVDSRDSRYLGFVPEEFVVGIVAEGR